MNSDSPFVNCRNCGEQNFRHDQNCWVCLLPLSGGDTGPLQKEDGKESTESQADLSIGTVEIVTTTSLILLTIGLASIDYWGLAIFMWLVLLPVGLAIRKRSRMTIDPSKPGSGMEGLVNFSSSIFVTIGCVVAVILAAGVGFFVTCWIGFFGGMVVGEAAGAQGFEPIEWGLVTGYSLGGFVGIYIAYRLIRRFWY